MELWASLGLKWPPGEFFRAILGRSRLTCWDNKNGWYFWISIQQWGFVWLYLLSILGLNVWSVLGTKNPANDLDHSWYTVIIYSIKSSHCRQIGRCRCPSPHRYTLPPTTAVQFGAPETSESFSHQFLDYGSQALNKDALKSQILCARIVIVYTLFWSGSYRVSIESVSCVCRLKHVEKDLFLSGRIQFLVACIRIVFS